MVRSRVTIRRLRAGDEEVVRRLATRSPRSELLADDATIFLAAFDGADSIGFTLAYELPRRHGDRSLLFVYEVEVAEAHRRRGIGTALLRQLGRIAREAASARGSSSPARRTSRRCGSTSRLAGRARTTTTCCGTSSTCGARLRIAAFVPNPPAGRRRRPGPSPPGPGSATPRAPRCGRLRGGLPYPERP